jgi:glycosyltransferase involved in cell wall biosynthesis
VKNRRVLVLAYKFPDLIVPGGSTRVEKFVKYLPRCGWDPIVLSVKAPRDAALEPVHLGPDVVRTPSHYGAFVQAYRTRFLEAEPAWRRRAVEVLRRLKNLFLVPDDAVLWWPRAIPAALRLVRRHTPALLFVSGPPNSGLLLGALLKRLTGVPFVADMRDDWAGNPHMGRRNAPQALLERPLERIALGGADRVLHATPASLDLYRARYPRVDQRLLPNGYDEEDFSALEPHAPREGRLELLHVGSLRGGRSPEPVFRALKLLADLDPRYERIRIRFVGTVHREHVEAARAAGCNGQVEWTERLPRREVVELMGRSDALLLLPAQDAPTAIPGKAYEYLRAGRPVLSVSDGNEATRFLKSVGGSVTRSPGDVAGVARVLQSWFDAPEANAPDPVAVERFARERLTGELARTFEEVLVS